MIESSLRLRKAVIEGNLPITLRLLSRFPELWLNIDPSHKGWCNLHYASYHGNYLICFHLISFRSKNIDDLRHQNSSSTIDMITFDELTVLHLPLIHHHAQTLHYLLQEFPGKVWLNYKGGPLKQTPLHYSCVHKFTEGLKLLLEFGADWTLVDSHGDTCLHLCFQFGFFDGIKVLLRFILTKNLHGAYIDQYYSTSAKLSEEPDTKDDLLVKFVKFESMTNNKGWTAVDYASSYELVDQYESFKKDLVRSLDNELSPSHQPVSEVAGHSSSSSSSLLQFGANHSQTSIPENRVLSSPIVPIQEQVPTKRGFTTPQQNSIKEPEKATPGRAHSRSLPGDTPVPDNIISLSVYKDEPMTRKRAETYNYKPPGALNLVAASSMSSPRSNSGPQTPLMTQPFVLNKTPSLKSVTISPLTRNHKSNNEPVIGHNETQLSPQSIISSINTSPEARKKSNASLAQVFMNQSPLMQETTNWPPVDKMPEILQPPAVPLQSPSHVAVAPVRKSTDPPTRERRSSSSASSIAAKIAFNSISNRSSPSTEIGSVNSISRRPSLSKISTFPRRFSRSNSSGLESPTLRKSKSANTVYGSAILSRSSSRDSKDRSKGSPQLQSSNSASSTNSSTSSNTINMDFLVPLSGSSATVVQDVLQQRASKSSASSISFNRVR